MDNEPDNRPKPHRPKPGTLQKAGKPEELHEEVYQGCCGKCGAPFVGVLPVSPLYALKTAASLVPCALVTLRKRLAQHRDELGAPIYRKDNFHTMRRYLRAWEVKLMREHLYYTRDENGKIRRIIDLYKNDTGEESGAE